MALSERTAFAMFCDDIRFEIGDKISMMGIYSTGTLQIPMQMPVAMSKLAVSVWLLSDIENPFEEFSIEILAPPNRTCVSRVEGKRNSTELTTPDLPADSRWLHLNQNIVLAPFIVQEEGAVEVIVTMDGESLRAGRLMVTALAPQSNSQAAPAS